VHCTCSALSGVHDVIISGVIEDNHDSVFSANRRRLLFLSRRHEVPFVSDCDREETIASLKSDGLYSLVLCRRDFRPTRTRPANRPA
jgi:hypothetical protein